MGKVVVITGAGTGRATVRALSRAGYDAGLRQECVKAAVRALGRRSMPVPPVCKPEGSARAILFAATHDRREIWVGMRAVVAILANRIAPGDADRKLAKVGYSGQITGQALPPDVPANLYEPVPGNQAAHGRFDRTASWEMFTDRHKTGVMLAGAAAGLFGLHLLATKLEI